eukprot:scaffold9.g3118.t1
MPEVGGPRHLVVIALEDLLELLEKEKSASGYPGVKKMFNKLYNLYPTEVMGTSGRAETWFGLEGFDREGIEIYLKECRVRADLRPLLPSEQPAPHPIVIHRAFEQMQADLLDLTQKGWGRAGRALGEVGPAAQPATSAQQRGSDEEAAVIKLQGVVLLEGWDAFLTVCIVPWEPMVICSPDGLPGAYTGHDVELFREVARTLDLKEGRDYIFVCTDMSSALANLTAPAGQSNCSLVVAGITVTMQRIAQGITFSYPYYAASLGVMTRSTTDSPSGWSFLHPFSGTAGAGGEGGARRRLPGRGGFPSRGRGVEEGGLWASLLVTVLCLPPLLLLMEWGSEPPARDEVAALCFGFVFLILVNSYTANLAALLTVTRINTEVKSIADLQGRAVGTNPIYIDRRSDLRRAADLVTSGSLAAALTDDLAVEYVVANDAPGCHLKMLPQTVLTFDYSAAFPRGVNSTLVDAVSEAILSLQRQALRDGARASRREAQEDGTLALLKASFIQSSRQGGRCPGSGEVASSSEEAQITFQDVWGLWVILGAGICVGLLITAYKRRLWLRRRLMCRIAVRQQQQRDVSGGQGQHCGRGDNSATGKLMRQQGREQV